MNWFESLRRKRTPRQEGDAPRTEKMDCGETVESSGGRQARLALLTPREHELFLLLLEGYTLKESARQLGVKYSTANTHMTGIYKKLNVNSRAELIIRYRDAGKKPE